MSGSVTLEAVNGELYGRSFRFDGHDIVFVGRSSSCQVCIPRDKEASRFHFALEVNPPEVQLRDLGSKNGTYVNGVKHGGHRLEGSAERRAGHRHQGADLVNGDRLRAGETVFELRVEKPQSREGRAGSEFSEGALRDVSGWETGVSCTGCGRDVSAETPVYRQGAYLCVACRSEPARLVRDLLARATTREPDLVAIEGYAIERELGRGGMGAVYLAVSDKTGEKIALKLMLPVVAVNARARTLFLREVDISKALKHRNVVKLRDSGCSDGTFFFTQEYCAGGSVSQLMKRRGAPLAIDEAVKIIFDVLKGLSYAHSVEMPRVALGGGTRKSGHGIVHRDLSPQNIFLSDTGPEPVAKVGDFGLSKAFDLAGLSGFTLQTPTGVVEGKPMFMARQQVINYKYAKPDVDVWAAAACLYCMMTGKPPRRFPDAADAWQIVLSERTVPVRDRNSSVPRRLAEVIDHALIDEPEIGFKSATELGKALERAL